jgi:monoamine oxidase
VTTPPFEKPPTLPPFAMEDMYRHPGELNDAPGTRKRVCVFGAGIAGLTAAYELTKHDHSVVVLEASDRAGGRIRSARFADGVHGELGAMRIPANHHATLHYVDAFGLKTSPFINTNPAAKYCIRGTTVARGDWQGLSERFELAPHERRDPLTVYETLMQKAMAMLSSDEKRQLFSGNFSSGQVRAYDAQTLWQFLRRWLSPEAIQYVGHATGMIWYEHASFLEALVDYFGLFRIDSVHIADGMDALPAAFARHLGDAVQYGSRVTAARVHDDGVDVTWESESSDTRTERFDYAICALPAPRAAAIDFTPGLPSTQLDALRRLTYASGTKTLLHCKTRPWEHVDGIYGGGSFTDLAIQQCWYPSDNARGVTDEVAVAFTGDDPGAAGRGYSRAPARWVARSRERSHAAGVLTASYAWETNARRFAALSEDERTEMVLADVAKLHPEVLPEVEDVVHVVWDDAVGGGTYAFYAPGDYQRFHGVMRQPFPHERPRVFFAGEHLAVSHAWIQGAVRTGWDAASYVAAMGSGAEAELCPGLADAELSA